MSTIFNILMKGDKEIEKAPSYYNQVYSSIKEIIFNGIFKPGDRIYEAKITNEF
jgi:DNA-binding GntR family transcriptional regulator